MSEWTDVLPLDDLPPGTGKEVVAKGHVVAVFNVDGTIYAMDGLCPHAGGPVGTGQLEGCIVTCPWHGWQFDVTNGQHTLSDALTHTTYPTRIEDQAIQVQLAAEPDA